ncbi:Uncharacterized protein SCF082_LOCUS18366 [Durusdinium trenchii]|uniref:Uncharacterized protein n=1 Tax=Durusdinium trenchii TaxID=1381693 RepID=A0ABP0KNJ1_9DINO
MSRLRASSVPSQANYMHARGDLQNTSARFRVQLDKPSPATIHADPLARLGLEVKRDNSRSRLVIEDIDQHPRQRTPVAQWNTMEERQACLAQSFLDCDDSWSDFRTRLASNAERGFPRDVELAVVAQDLVQQYGDDLEVDPGANYGASRGMRTFTEHCNAPTPKGDFCLYGLVSALWMIARHDHPDSQNLLQHANFLLGSTMNHVLDFTESSAWPIGTLDILANLESPDRFLLPAEIKQRATRTLRPLAVVESQRLPERFEHPPIRLEVWELGVHASLSAEAIQMLLRTLAVAEFKFRNILKDQYPLWLPEKCQTLYWHPRLDCTEPEDEITELFRSFVPLSATSKEPIVDMDRFIREFEKVAGQRLNFVDLLVCTVPYLCLLFEPVDLPTIGYFGHPLLFMVPEEEELREKFWKRFADMEAKSGVAFAVSDPFLQMQYEYQLGRRLTVLRTHALYTGATHMPQRPEEILVLDRPHEAILMCTLQRLLGEPLDWRTSDGRLRAAGSATYPFRFLTRQLTDKKFSTFAQFRAVALWPYDMDLITFYEFYGMNMPIFMPSHLSKYIFHQDHEHYDFRWAARNVDYESPEPALWSSELTDRSPFEESSPEAVARIVEYADYFRFPEVQHFDSIPALLEMLLKVDFFESLGWLLALEMARFNQDSLVETLRSWKGRAKEARASLEDDGSMLKEYHADRGEEEKHCSLAVKPGDRIKAVNDLNSATLMLSELEEAAKPEEPRKVNLEVSRDISNVLSPSPAKKPPPRGCSVPALRERPAMERQTMYGRPPRAPRSPSKDAITSHRAVTSTNWRSSSKSGQVGRARACGCRA